MTAPASPRQVLLDLADRCERAEPSWDFSVEIELAIVPGAIDRRSWDPWVAVGLDSIAYNPPAYTTSLDAAVTLVPEGWHQIIGQNWSAGTWACELRQPNESDPYGTKEACGTARTEAMARCAAALRARAEAL